MTDGLSRTPSDGKSSHGLWPGELKMPIVLFFFLYVHKTTIYIPGFSVTIFFQPIYTNYAN
jgi:hypothetical protein